MIYWFHWQCYGDTIELLNESDENQIGEVEIPVGQYSFYEYSVFVKIYMYWLI